MPTLAQRVSAASICRRLLECHLCVVAFARFMGHRRGCHRSRGKGYREFPDLTCGVNMRSLLVSLALSACALVASASPLQAQAVGKPAPEFGQGKWYKSPPLTMEQLRGKAVLIVVFRTW